ncbi:MAG: hypothetical protein ACYC0N_00670 [Carboxydocellales bacterium]
MPVTVNEIKNVFLKELAVNGFRVNRIGLGRYGLRTAEGKFIASGTAEQIVALVNGQLQVAS